MAIFNVSVGGTIYDADGTAIPNCSFQAYFDSYAGTHPAMWQTTIGTANSSGVFQFNLGDSNFLYEDTEGTGNVSGDNLIIAAWTGGTARTDSTLTTLGFIVLALDGSDTYTTDTDLRLRSNQEPVTSMSIGTSLARQVLQTLVNNSTDNTDFTESTGNYATTQYQYDDTNDISGVANTTIFDYVGVSHVSVDWGDSSTGTATGESNITHTYTETGGSTVTITGTAADNMGLLDSTPWSQSVNILYRAPTISSMDWTPKSSTEPVPNQTATMVATIGDLDSRGTAQYWSVDGGSTYPHTAASVGDNFLYAFSTSGTFSVVTKVAWNDGFANQEEISSTLSVIVRNNIPTASFTLTSGYPASADATSYIWDASASSDSDGTVDNYNWNMYESSDSGTSYAAAAISSLSGTASTFSFNFTSAGYFKLTLVVTDNDGQDSAIAESEFSVVIAPSASGSGFLIIGSPILQEVT